MKRSVSSCFGVKYSMLTVLDLVSRNKRGCAIVSAECECGAVVHALLFKIKQGLKKSCGCSTSKMISAAHRVHGMSQSGSYVSWRGMLRRVSDSRHQNYERYKSLGVTVDPKWLKFESFYADMGDRPAGMTLERKCNSKGYSKGNCKWATRVEQQNNTRRNRMLSLDGEKLSVSQWAKRTGLNRNTIDARIFDYGWTVRRALSTPAQLRLTPEQRRLLQPTNA